jgi:hypothetical protein
MFVAQNFSTSHWVTSDSLYKLSLNGSEGKFGFIKIADEYSGTDAANLNYYAGMAYLNTAKYTEAIEYLSSNRKMLFGCFGKGAIGDAAQNNQKRL